jgi:hypothetical protein
LELCKEKGLSSMVGRDWSSVGRLKGLKFSRRDVLELSRMEEQELSKNEGLELKSTVGGGLEVRKYSGGLDLPYLIF